MVTSPMIKSSKVAFDGALPMVVNLGRAAFATAAQDNIGAFVSPCDGTIVKAQIRMLASTTATAAKVSIGNSTASGATLTAYPLNAKAAGEYEIPLTASNWTKKTVTKGEYVKVKLPAATAVGSFAATLVIMPTAVNG